MLFVPPFTDVLSSQAGANVALLYNSGADEATTHANNLESTYKVKIKTYQCDTTKPERSAEVIELAAKDFGRLDVLVCNAGVCKHVCLPRFLCVLGGVLSRYGWCRSMRLTRLRILWIGRWELMSRECFSCVRLPPSESECMHCYFY